MKARKHYGMWTLVLAAAALLLAAPPSMADENVTGNLNVSGSVNAGVAVRGQYAIYANGRADGGDTVYESAGYNNWTVDNYLGRMRFFSNHLSLFLDAGGVHVLRNIYGSQNLIMDNRSASGGILVMRSAGNTEHLINNQGGTLRFYMAGAENLAITAGGNVGVGTTTPATKLDVVGDATVRGDMVCEVVDIRGEGALDLAEAFAVNDTTVQPGMVVAIDPPNPGQLTTSREAYDRKVAGIISGAGNLKAGIQLGANALETAGNHPVALSGRVWCWTDAAYGAVRPGDLLTTSDTAGHAMKVSDHSRATGAVLGKAMTELPEGKGLVLVLVTLQ